MVKKKAKAKSNLEKLVAAKMVDHPEKLTYKDNALIKKLTSAEVAALISAQKKIGSKNVDRMRSSGNAIF